jgi:hypothetical protein
MFYIILVRLNLTIQICLIPPLLTTPYTILSVHHISLFSDTEHYLKVNTSSIVQNVLHKMCNHLGSVYNGGRTKRSGVIKGGDKY